MRWTGGVQCTSSPLCVSRHASRLLSIALHGWSPTAQSVAVQRGKKRKWGVDTLLGAHAVGTLPLPICWHVILLGSKKWRAELKTSVNTGLKMILSWAGGALQAPLLPMHCIWWDGEHADGACLQAESGIICDTKTNAAIWLFFPLV